MWREHQSFSEMNVRKLPQIKLEMKSGITFRYKQFRKPDLPLLEKHLLLKFQKRKMWDEDQPCFERELLERTQQGLEVMT